MFRSFLWQPLFLDSEVNGKELWSCSTRCHTGNSSASICIQCFCAEVFYTEKPGYSGLVVTGCHEFYFPINIGNLIIPIDFPIFQRGGPGPPTSWLWLIESYHHQMNEFFLKKKPVDVEKKHTPSEPFLKIWVQFRGWGDFMDFMLNIFSFMGHPCTTCNAMPGEISLPSTPRAQPQRVREDWKWFRTVQLEKLRLNQGKWLVMVHICSYFKG